MGFLKIFDRLQEHAAANTNSDLAFRGVLAAGSTAVWRGMVLRCTHAATIAQVDEEQLFYLTCRGLDDEAAKALIIESFLGSLVERLAEGPVRDSISEALETRLAEIL